MEGDDVTYQTEGLGQYILNVHLFSQKLLIIVILHIFFCMRLKEIEVIFHN